VVAFLPLAAVGRASRDAQTAQGIYLAMEVIGWYALVPLAFATLLTGLVQSLGTQWWLFRHYWVLFKFLITAVSTIILLVYMQTLGFMAGVAAEAAATGAVPAVLRSGTAVMHASLALVALLVATSLSLYKPRGLTPYGQRKQRTQADAAASSASASTRATPRWVKAIGAIVLLLVLLLAIRMVVGSGGHGPDRHGPAVEHSEPSP